MSTNSPGPWTTGRRHAGVRAEILAWSVQPGSTMQLLAAIGIGAVLWQFFSGGREAVETLSSLAGLAVVLWKSPSGLRRLASYGPSLLEPGVDTSTESSVSLRHRTVLAALVLPLTLASLGACGPAASDDMAEEAVDGVAESPANTASAAITIANVGFATPESVLHDPSADVYLVSNINGAPTDHDGNGFISRVSLAGEVLDLKWIDGEADGVTLSAPKGMAIAQGLLWVTDIDCVRMFDLASGAPSGEVCIDGAAFLNDLAPHPAGEGVLLTDTGLDASFAPTGADALYHLSADAYAPIVADAEFGAPNGVATTADGGVFVVTFMSGQVFRVTGEIERTQVLEVEGAQFDGIEVLADGRMLLSNWTSSCVHLLATDGTLSCAVPDVEAPADIGFDFERGLVLVPLFNANEVRIIPLG